MSDVVTDARRLLRVRLSGLTLGDEAIAWEGEKFQPPDPKASWVRETLKPQETEKVTLGTFARLVTNGLYLIDCFTPQMDGTDASDELVASVLTLFPPALTLTEGSRIVRLLAVSRGGAMPSAEWLMVSVTIRWQTDAINTI